ncbi:helix-turn-helix transcriptional regulator [Bacillus sp. 3255]|uniref:helix-turn-helix transcriptional regulator n=1 Tax=Bacillus sp. 3255 TaxID=2817904 RepID=UPI00285A374B|nr:helix-turn-helix transcriptional regulator [Bacillus sp. 3255]MDR6880389.1 putative transcriptional regulator [Bacillus sp. 3255]
MQSNTLKQLRVENALTLQDMATKVAVSKPYYWQIENGKRRLSYELAVKISAVLGKKPDEIFLESKLTKSEQKSTSA